MPRRRSYDSSYYSRMYQREIERLDRERPGWRNPQRYVNRTSTLTSVTAARTGGSTSRPQRVSVEEYEANPKRWRDPIPVTSSQTGQVAMYVARRGG